MDNKIFQGVSENELAIRQAFEVLRTHKIPHTTSLEAFEDMLDSLRRKPDADDERWPLVEVVDVTTHLTDEDERPVFSAALMIGRAYSLSPAQRDVVRKWFNMTPAPLVEVIDLKLFDGTKFVQHVVLRSCEHIDPRRKRVMNKFTIDRWGKFMSQVQARETEIAAERELERYTGRIVTLMDNAKAAGIRVGKTVAGYLASRLQAEVNENRASDDPKRIREILRKLLISHNEHELARLVKEPKYWPDRVDGKATVVKIKSLDVLMGEYGV